MDFSKVQETFPELGSDLLCKLAEMIDISPSRVLELVPGASPDQLAQFLKIAEAAIQVEENHGRQEASKAPRRSMTPGGQDTISLLGQLKQLPAKVPEVTSVLESPTREKSAFMDALKKLVPPEEGGVQAAFHRFGERRGMKALSPLVCKLYNDALATSSKKTYKTGTNNFKKFLAAFPKVATVDLPTPPPSQYILTLCFFAVALFLKKSIKSASTIRSYVRHVKNQWIQNGCDPEALKSNVLDRVLKGLKRWLPSKRDARPAFLLPHYKIPARFCHPTSGKLCASIAAVIFGFFGRTFSRF